MTQQLAARSVSPFNQIFCSSGAVPSLAEAQMPDYAAGVTPAERGSGVRREP